MSVKATLELLRAHYLAFQKPRPLAVGVQEILLAKHAELPEKELKTAIRKYCGTLAYQKALARNKAQRVDLDGNPVELVSESQRALASVRVAGIREKKPPKPPPPPPTPPKPKFKAKPKLGMRPSPRAHSSSTTSPPVQPTVLLKVSRKLQMVGAPTEPLPPVRPLVSTLKLKRPV